MASTPETKRRWIEPTHPEISIARQRELVGLARSSDYAEPAGETAENLEPMRLLDEQATRTPFYGVRRLTAWPRSQGRDVNPKRVGRLMRVMGLRTIYPRPRLSRPGGGQGHRVYPYLLRDVPVTRPDHVWSTDITDIRLASGFIYLAAVIDWYSRDVLSWEVSVSLETAFCLSALAWALAGRSGPEIVNTDQGAQYTSAAFVGRLERDGILVSMDGRGRALDNVFVERVWRTVKYEEVYLKGYQSVAEAIASLRAYFALYNTERLHQALGYRTPAEVYCQAAA